MIDQIETKICYCHLVTNLKFLTVRLYTLSSFFYLVQDGPPVLAVSDYFGIGVITTKITCK